METGEEEVKVPKLAVVELGLLQSHPSAPVLASSYLPVRPLSISTSKTVSAFILRTMEMPTVHIFYGAENLAVLASQ